MKILLTGSAGFLGRNLYGHMQKLGHQVVGIDIKKSPTTNFEFNFASAMLPYMFYEFDFDVILHTGAIADVYEAASHPRRAYEVNILGTNEVVNICFEHKIPLIYASTWEVYGEAQYLPIDEQHPTLPDHPYNISKLAGELVVRNKLHPINYCILRMGTLYGPNMRESAVIPKFISLATEGKDITIHGTGEQFRQFTHVNDVCSAFEAVINTFKEGIYNVVADEQISIKFLAESLKNYFPKLEISYEAVRKADIASSVVSSEKFKKELGWKPQIKFIDGLKEMVDVSLNQ